MKKCYAKDFAKAIKSGKLRKCQSVVYAVVSVIEIGNSRVQEVGSVHDSQAKADACKRAGERFERQRQKKNPSRVTWSYRVDAWFVW